MSILSTSHIVKKYANHAALDDVSITVPKGSIYGLLGPNGAGKTSLIRIMNQITAPDQGEVLFDGHPLKPEHAAQIGYLPEERGLYKKMEVGEQAIYLAQLKGMKKKEAEQKLREWFEQFEMTAWWRKKVEELSKGMQQKLQFVVTVLHEPQLLILDEPFSGFDPINANLIKDEIIRLKKKGTTVIFSTHNMVSVEELCDHIALINKSKKILEGAVKEIRKTYKSDTYRIEFTGSMMGFANSLWSEAEILDKSEQDGVCKVKIKLLRGATPNQMLESVLPSIKIISFNEVIPGMNDIFISKVNE